MPTINMEATGLNIKNLITKNNMTVKDVAITFGFASVNPVYKWINGKTLPALDNLVVLAKVLDTKIDDIIVVN